MGWSGIMHSEVLYAPRSEEPHKDLGRKQSQASAEHNPRDLPLRTHFSEHEGESADYDCHQGERTRERAGERSFEIARRALPRSEEGESAQS